MLPKLSPQQAAALPKESGTVSPPFRDPIAFPPPRFPIDPIPLPPDLFETHADYKAKLRGETDAQLEADAKRLTARIADASSGPVQDKDAVAKAKAELAEVREEQAARKEIAGSKDPKYGGEVHRMTDAQLATERARQEERYQEATTGLDRDPAKAADAKAKLSVIDGERAARAADVKQGLMPFDPPTKPLTLADTLAYSAKVAGMSDKQREAERARLEAVIKDASTGAHQDPTVAANARQELGILERADHRAEESVAGYKEHLRGETDQQLAAEKKHEEAVLKDATSGAHQDPDAAARARAKLRAIDSEQSTRAEIAKSQDPKYGAQVHGMDDQQLATERARQEERYKEATTGLDRDPAKAADAKAKLEQITREQFRRAIDKVFGGQLPKDVSDKPLTVEQKLAYRQDLRSMSDSSLAAEKKRLEAVVKDASSGPNRDAGAVKNAQDQLALVNDELADRARIAKGPMPEYGKQVHAMKDIALDFEVARQEERLKEATTGLDRDPKVAADAREKLKVLQAEQADRRGDTFRIEFGALPMPIKAMNF